MKVFKIRMDGDRYQTFYPVNRDDVWTLRMDGTSKIDSWTPPPVYVLHPKLRAGGFYNANRSHLIASPRATEALYNHFSFAGELLPLLYKEQTFTLLNVTQCIDVLDQERSEFEIGHTSGTKYRILTHAFHADRFVETSLFKIPDFNCSEIFVLEGANDFEMEFREAVEEAGLEGLIFTEVWNNEG